MFYLWFSSISDHSINNDTFNCLSFYFVSFCILLLCHGVNTFIETLLPIIMLALFLLIVKFFDFILQLQQILNVSLSERVHYLYIYIVLSNQRNDYC